MTTHSTNTPIPAGQRTAQPEGNLHGFLESMTQLMLAKRKDLRAMGYDVPASAAFPEEQISSGGDNNLHGQSSVNQGPAGAMTLFHMQWPIDVQYVQRSTILYWISHCVCQVTEGSGAKPPTVAKVLAAIRRETGLLSKDLRQIVPDYRNLIEHALASRRDMTQ